ncbi:MAG: type II secretion system protein [Huintestinicola sp.]|uniref:type II secretion system protein n=1 Tax=Huintestinicola sp. TaxID=2981661 RepID=UPI003EFCC092
MSKAKAKGFTLVELIVAMAVFSILMLGIMQIAGPMSEAAATNEVVNNQKMVENNIVTYIGETLRYATNVMVIEGKSGFSPDDAIKAFAKENPVDALGNPYFANPNSPTDAEKLKVRLICFDRSNTYKYKNIDYSGRLIATIPGRTTNTMSFSNIKQDGTSNLYEVFGNDYYNHAEYYLTAQIKDNQLYLNVDSDYYYNNNRNGNFNNSSTNPVEGTFELRSPNNSKAARICKSIKQGGTADKQIASAGRGTSNIVYFVYIYPEHYTD